MLKVWLPFDAGEGQVPLEPQVRVSSSALQGRSSLDHFRAWIRESIRYAWSPIAFGVVALFAVHFVIRPHGFAAIWPANAVLFVGLWKAKRSHWLGIAAIAFLVNVGVNLSAGIELGASIGFSVANIIEATLAALLLGMVPGAMKLTTVRHVVQFGLLVLVIAAGVGAAIGAMTGHVMQPAEFQVAWFSWWMADELGLAVVVPVLLGLIDSPRLCVRVTDGARVVELMALVSLTGIVSWVLFTTSGATSYTPFIAFPLLIWAATRWGKPGASVASLVLSSIVIVAFLNRAGAHTAHVDVFTMQAFLMPTVFALLVLGASATERSSMDRALRRVMGEYSSMLKHLPGMAYRCENDSEWTMLYVSDGCERLTGYRPEQLLGNQCTTYDQLIHPDCRSQVRTVVTDAVERNQPFEITYRIVTANGDEKWVWEQGRSSVDGEVLEGLIVDITAQKVAEEVERERLALERSTSVMRDALGVVGHELRTPLTAIGGLIECVITECQITSKPALEMLEQANQQVGRMANLINNVLEGARLDSGQAAWNWRIFRVRDVAEASVNLVQHVAQADELRFICKVDPRHQMSGDADAILRVLINLLTNAVRFTRVGQITVTGREVVDDNVRWMELRVSDTGDGMPPEIMTRLGHAFSLNQGSVGSSYVAGVGLGLAICRRITAVHGGRIHVQSEEGSGTVITVRLRADLPSPLTYAEHDEGSVIST